MKFDTENSTTKIRWVMRDGVRILQQWWMLYGRKFNADGGGQTIFEGGEWRDVPTETES